MASLKGFRNVEITQTDQLKQGEVLVKNPNWNEKSKEPKYIKVPGAYVRDGKLWQVAQFKCADGSYMVPVYDK